ncbi:MAG: hypothetical protein JWQ20_148, partial [Conexibacter sp.]|nr:hypothetical protein [Conexibacter sp.]
HIAPTFGPLQLRAIRVQTIQQWQAERLAAGAGPVAVRQALDLAEWRLASGRPDGYEPVFPNHRGGA